MLGLLYQYQQYREEREKETAEKKERKKEREEKKNMSRKLASLFGSIMRVRSASSSSSSATPSPIIGRFCSGAAGPDNGCDYKHWLIEVEKPEGTRDEIIDGYVKLVASVLGRYIYYYYFIFFDKL